MELIDKLISEYKKINLQKINYDQWGKHHFEGKGSTYVLTDSCNLRCSYCLVAGTKILMQNFSYKNIEEIKEGDFVLGFEEYSRNRYKHRLCFPTKVTKTSKRKDNIIKIKTENNELFITNDHPILNTRGNSEYCWKNAGEYKVGNLIRSISQIQKSEIQKDINYKIGYFISCMLGDGTFGVYKYRKTPSQYKIRLAVKDDEIIERVDKYSRELGIEFDKYPFKISKKLNMTKDALLTNKKNYYYRLLDLILSNLNKNRDTNYLAGFLAGIYDTEGLINKDGSTIRIFNSDDRIIKEIEIALQYFNIGYILETPKKGKNKEISIVRLKTTDKKADFINILDFILTADPAVKRKGTERLLNRSLLTSEKIIGIEESGEEYVYNIETESHTYIANNIAVHNCYILEKPDGHVMSWEVAKKYTDYLFEMNAHLDKIEKPTPFDHAKIFEFVGGEPLLEYKLMFKIIDYINNRVLMLPKNHPWRKGIVKENGDVVDGYRFSLSSNGTLLKDLQIRKEFEIRGSSRRISLGISIDGPKEIHDLCRKKIDGSGSFDDIMGSFEWWKLNFPGDAVSTKATISHENLHMINTISKFFFEELQIERLYINTIFEDVWHKGDDILFLNQLCDLVDWLIEDEKYKKYYISFFGNTIGGEREKIDGAWCGAGKHMDACGYDGKLYPCLRFKTLYKREPLVIGTVNTGKDTDIMEIFNSKNTINMFNKTKELTGIDCLKCKISSGCADCQGYSYDCSGDLYTKVTFICPMHGARFCANIYFFGRILGFIDKKDRQQTLLPLLEEINKDRRIHMK